MATWQRPPSISRAALLAQTTSYERWNAKNESQRNLDFRRTHLIQLNAVAGPNKRLKIDKISSRGLAVPWGKFALCWRFFNINKLRFLTVLTGTICFDRSYLFESNYIPIVSVHSSNGQYKVYLVSGFWSRATTHRYVLRVMRSIQFPFISFLNNFNRELKIFSDKQ